MGRAILSICIQCPPIEATAITFFFVYSLVSSFRFVKGISYIMYYSLFFFVVTYKAMQEESLTSKESVP